MIRALLSAQVDRALERLPREPHLHAKRALGRQAFEDAEALDALGGPAEPAEGDLLEAVRARIAVLDPSDAETGVLVLLQRRLEHRPDPPLQLFAPETLPARDPFVEIGPGSSPVNDALVLAEAAATTAREVDWATKLRLIDVVATQLDRTAELDEDWGAHPVSVSRYDVLMALPVGDRVEKLLSEGARRDEDAAV